MRYGVPETRCATPRSTPAACTSISTCVEVICGRSIVRSSSASAVPKRSWTIARIALLSRRERCLLTTSGVVATGRPARRGRCPPPQGRRRWRWLPRSRPGGGDHLGSEYRAPGHDVAVAQLDTGQVVVHHYESGQLAAHDANSAGLERRCLGRRGLVRVGEIDDVARSLSNELGVEDRRRVGTEHTEGLVAHLPAVAVTRPAQGTGRG